PVLFFFFQAEDGIRDYKVTGVQTCALPIYEESFPCNSRRCRICRAWAAMVAGGWNPEGPWPHRIDRQFFQLLHDPCKHSRGICRSEERRVGKECRSWSAA